MITNKRTILTVAAVITTVTMAGGVGAVALESQHAPPPTVATAQIAAQAPVPVQFHDDAGGGDS